MAEQIPPPFDIYSHTVRNSEDIAVLKSQMSAIKGEFADLRAEVHKEFDSIRQHLGAQDGTLGAIKDGQEVMQRVAAAVLKAVWGIALVLAGAAAYFVVEQMGWHGQVALLCAVAAVGLLGAASLALLRA